MTSSSRWAVRSLAAFIALAVSLTVYALTLAPSLTWSHWGRDSGDFVTAAVTGRVPHPPGFPLYMILARLGVGLVPGDPARTLNGLSSLMAALTVGVTTLACTIHTDSLWAGMTAGLSLAFAPLFWSQALITEVYTSAAFFLGLALLLIQFHDCELVWPIWMAGLALGLAGATHPVTLSALIYFVSRTRRRSAGLGVGMVIGFVFYATLPMISRPWPQPWGDLSTLKGWWAYVSARMYRHYAFGLPLRYWPQRSLAWFVSVVRQVTPLGGILIALGSARLFERRRLETVGLWASVGVVGLFSIGYNTDDSLVYLVPVLPLVMIVLAYGVGSLRRWTIPPWLGLIVPVLLLVVNWQTIDISEDWEAVDWVRDTLRELPDYALAVTENDRHTFGLWYGTEARTWRPDVLVVDRWLWEYGAYRRYLASLVDIDWQDLGTVEDLVGERPHCEIGSTGVQCP